MFCALRARPPQIKGTCVTLQTIYGVRSAFTPILKIRKLRHREMRIFAWSYRASKCWVQDVNPGRLSIPLTTTWAQISGWAMESFNMVSNQRHY